VRRLRDEGMTVFLTTHYLDEADALADRIAIIDNGEIVAEGTSDELKREIAGDVIELGVSGDQARARALLANQPYVREVEHSDDGHIRLYVEQGESAMPQILRLLDGEGLGLDHIGLHRPSLDDVFLRKTGRSLRDEAA
jgi:ABC-2 type transport system ATP-binding protein